MLKRVLHHQMYSNDAQNRAENFTVLRTSCKNYTESVDLVEPFVPAPMAVNGS